MKIGMGRIARKINQTWRRWKKGNALCQGFLAFNIQRPSYLISRELGTVAFNVAGDNIGVEMRYISDPFWKGSKFGAYHRTKCRTFVVEIVHGLREGISIVFGSTETNIYGARWKCAKSKRILFTWGMDCVSSSRTAKVTSNKSHEEQKGHRLK